MISNIDLNDWEQGDVTPLYNLERDTHFQILGSSTVFHFLGLDGMYSRCVSPAGDMVHLAAWTEVVPLTPR